MYFQVHLHTKKITDEENLQDKIEKASFHTSLNPLLRRKLDAFSHLIPPVQYIATRGSSLGSLEFRFFPGPSVTVSPFTDDGLSDSANWN
jgi:hypothetical protein